MFLVILGILSFSFVCVGRNRSGALGASNDEGSVVGSLAFKCTQVTGLDNGVGD